MSDESEEEYNPEMVELLLKLQKQNPEKTFRNLEELLAYQEPQMTLDELINSLPEDRREAVRQRVVALIVEEKRQSDREIVRKERAAKSPS